MAASVGDEEVQGRSPHSPLPSHPLSSAHWAARVAVARPAGTTLCRRFAPKARWSEAAQPRASNLELEARLWQRRISSACRAEVAVVCKFFNEVWVPAPNGRSIVREQLESRAESLLA